MKRLSCLVFGLLTHASAAIAVEQPLSREEILKRADVTAVWQPVPPEVSPGIDGAPPTDAVVLFAGQGLDAWQSRSGEAAGWAVANGVMTVVPGSGDILTRRAFGSVQLHLEWRAPREIEGDGQGRGNSGIFFMDRYEVQVLDSYDNPTYPNGQAASVYKQHIPLVNASRAPGERQVYDIIFTAPVFGVGGRPVRPAYVTVLHNGVLVQHHVPLHGPTLFIGKPQYEAHGKAPIRLQDHSNPVSFRNVWVREL